MTSGRRRWLERVTCSTAWFRSRCLAVCAAGITLFALGSTGAGAVPRRVASQNTAVPSNVDDVTPFLTAGSHAVFFVAIARPASCSLTFNGPARRRAGPFRVRAARLHVQYSWRVPRNAAVGAWVAHLKCGSGKPLVQDFKVSGKRPKRGGTLVVPGSMHVGFSSSAPTLSEGPATQVAGLGGGNPGFPYGQCTYWAWLNRPDIYEYAVAHGQPHGGWNGYVWATFAVAAGELTGSLPVAHALVTFEPGVYGAAGGTGHIAYVEKVEPNGTRFEISEMNVPEGNSNVNYRWLNAPVRGMTFIYGPPGSPAPTGSQGGEPGGLPDGGSVRGTFSADVNGDGRADLVAVDEKATFVMLSTGSGFSAPAAWSTTPFYGTHGTFTGDVNGDGKADLIAVNEGNTYVMLSTGSGFSAPQLWSSTPFYGSKATLAGDVNGDGKADLIAVNEGNTYVMLSTGSGFSAPQLWSSTPFYGSKATLAGDVNGDGKADLIAVNNEGTWVMRSTGSSFSAPEEWQSGAFYGNRTTVAGDVNGDGKADLIAVNDTSAWVMRSTGSSFSSPEDWHEGAFYGS
jgi:surface antigen